MSKLLINSLFAALLLFSVQSQADPMAAFELHIDNVADAKLGETVEISIESVSGSEIFNSFILLVSFDAEELQFIEALEGNALASCQWEDFSYFQVACPGCDEQLYQIEATADADGGGSWTGCYLTTGELVRLRIKLPVDVSFAGELFTIDFYWEDCSSNTFNSIVGDTIWLGKFAYDYEGNDRTGKHPHLGSTLPGCVAPDGVVPIRGINYYSGSVSISSELGLFGDINGDGRVNITDATYLLRYLFNAGPPPQDYLSGDLNMDGVTNLSDALFLLEYIFGL